MDKVERSAADAVAGIADHASLAVGGFGLSGVPNVLIEAVHARGIRGLSVVSNNCGVDGGGLGILLAAGRIARVTGSYIGENKEFARQYLGGEIEVELVPQGTLAERLRAGGCGIPAFYTPAGVGTQVADGGLPWRYAPDGAVAVPSRRRRSGRSTAATTSWSAASPPTSRSCGRPGATATETWSSAGPPGTSTRSPRWRAV